MNPTQVPMKPLEMVKFRHWVQTEAQKIVDEEVLINKLMRAEILRAWAVYHPEMMAELNKAGIAEQFADVCQAKMWEAQEQYQEAGMPWPDSKEQACLEWLMMYPPEQPEELEAAAED